MKSTFATFGDFELRNRVLMDKLFFRIRFVLSRVILCCFISIIGCQSPSDSADIPSITIDAPKDKISFPLSEITEKIDVIELETNEFSFIRGEIQSVHILEDHLIIDDTSPGVLVFDMHGNFVRQIGKQGQGPGEISSVTIHVQTDAKNGTIWLWLYHKFIIYDINGNLVQDKLRDKPPTFFEYFYYSNDSVFIIQAIDEKVGEMEYSKEISFIIKGYSNGNYSDKLLDSLLIRKYEPWVPPVGGVGFIKTIFQHQGQVYMFFSVCNDDEEYDYLYVIKNNQFVPFARFLVKSTIRDLTVTDRYMVAIHGNLLWDNTKMPQIMTLDMLRALRNSNSKGPERDFSYYVYDYKTGKNINSYHGFIDDIHHTNEIIPINFIDGGEKVFYVREGKWSEELKTELNPTLYIGKLKEFVHFK